MADDNLHTPSAATPADTRNTRNAEPLSNPDSVSPGAVGKAHRQQPNAENQRRFRATHRRIDYVPQPAVAGVIEQHRQASSKKSLSRVIDQLVMAGHAAITGNLGAGATGRDLEPSRERVRKLTQKQEEFACTVATTNQSLAASYHEVYKPQTANIKSVNHMAARVAALPHVAARIRSLRGAVCDAVVKRTGLTRQDLIAEAGDLRQRAIAAGHIGAALAATKLRALLAGLLPGSNRASRRTQTSNDFLQPGDLESLLKVAQDMKAPQLPASQPTEPVAADGLRPAPGFRSP